MAGSHGIEECGFESMLLSLQDAQKSCHLCPSSSSMKPKFIHNRKTKTPTRCHYVIWLGQGQEVSGSLYHIRFQNLKSIADTLIVCSFGKLFTSATSWLWATPIPQKTALLRLRTAIKSSCPSRRLRHALAHADNPVWLPLVPPKKPTTSWLRYVATDHIITLGLSFHPCTYIIGLHELTHKKCWW